ncbi:unnamed protein product [Ilex paraguariensis]|uniref:Dicarboxylate transporter 2.1, chloroplastic n=1 Tax=Ilex paraguariensis TaxID=185542 RepID=A0ABC8TX45_9AQUA
MKSNDAGYSVHLSQGGLGTRTQIFHDPPRISKNEATNPVPTLLSHLVNDRSALAYYQVSRWHVTLSFLAFPYACWRRPYGVKGSAGMLFHPSNSESAVRRVERRKKLLLTARSSGNSSALFLTAAAQNLICLKLAEELGVIVASPWVSWFKAASLPALISLLASPFVLYKLYPPEIKDTPDAPAMASKKLDLMGPVTRNEWVMVGTMLLAVSLWVFGEALGIASVVAAMLCLSMLLLFGVLDWDDCLSDKSAWDTLAWFAVLVGMAGQLTNLGIVAWMSGCVAVFLQSFSLSWPVAFVVLQAAYFFIHYLFASQTGHVGALYSAFLAMHLASGVPGVLAALALAYNTSLFGALTHYSSGQAAVYFGAGYVDLPDVFKFGFIMALVNAVIWGVAGTFWWKFLGLY